MFNLKAMVFKNGKYLRTRIVREIIYMDMVLFRLKMDNRFLQSEAQNSETGNPPLIPQLLILINTGRPVIDGQVQK